tara:strand:+ start:2345 stop:3109 length:765 start_codon:yes stop_codon:yes gene_type:complete
MRLNKADKVSKEEVMYRHGTESELDKGYVCGKCLYFDNGQCELVKGDINPKHWCRLFVTELAKDEVHMQLANFINKEDGGGVGFGAETGGTVWTSNNPGSFTPTHGDSKKKKKRGVDHLVDFVTENSPEKKMVKQESHATAGHGFMGDISAEPNWKKKRRETDNPNPVEPKENAMEGMKDQAAVDQNSFTNKLVGKIKEDKRRKGSSAEIQDTGSAVGNLALAWGFGDDELRRSGKKDKIPTNSQITKEEEKKQ